MKTLISVFVLLTSALASAEWETKTALDTKNLIVAMQVHLKIDNEIMPGFDHLMFCSYGKGHIKYQILDQESDNKTPTTKEFKIRAVAKLDKLIKEISDAANQMTGFKNLIEKADPNDNGIISKGGKVDLDDLKDIFIVSDQKALYDKVIEMESGLNEICNKNASK